MLLQPTYKTTKICPDSWSKQSDETRLNSQSTGPKRRRRRRRRKVSVGKWGAHTRNKTKSRAREEETVRGRRPKSNPKLFSTFSPSILLEIFHIISPAGALFFETTTQGLGAKNRPKTGVRQRKKAIRECRTGAQNEAKRSGLGVGKRGQKGRGQRRRRRETSRKVCRGNGQNIVYKVMRCQLRPKLCTNRSVSCTELLVLKMLRFPPIFQFLKRFSTVLHKYQTFF